ncbi:MAG TPA: Holliday junction branch migration DNA helicase RuvB [Alphaproteobacteria bacterium]|nr:Holliday junction branch migration DNA helicase RuvB [Alphaproteobacteria bacterium]
MDFETDRLVDGQKAHIEDFGQHEQSIRPDRLEGFIGQDKLKQNLRIFIESAKKRSKSLDHIIFHGPPGLGKTTLAQIISKEMETGFRSTSGPIIEKSGDLAAILTSLEKGDVLFIDEIHRLPTAVEEVLYPAMEDFQLDIIIGDGPSARTVKIDLPEFTLVGATTRAGMLSNPLRDRFGVHMRMEFYTSEELAIIVANASVKIGIQADSEGCFEIARRARGTPRIANRLLRRVADFATVQNNGVIDKAMADIALKALDVDSLGLDKNDYRYLNAILDKFNGGPVGVETIAAAIGESKDTIEDMIEPFLIQQGFIQRTPRGRVVLPAAYQHLNREVPKKLVDQLELF